MPDRKLRYGMIGGGRGAFIGAVHRIAAAMDGRAVLVAGAFASDAARSRDSGQDLGLLPERVYGDFEQMAVAERARGPDTRLDFVVIVTPNDTHLAAAKLFLESGFNVVLDKPLASTLTEGLALREVVRRSGKVFMLTHNYVGHALVRQARSLLREGRLGTIRKVVAEYSQGWLANGLEQTGNKQALWRTDPVRSGPSGCLSDIGTHAEHLMRYVTGLEISELCAELTSFVPGRALDDDGMVLLRFTNGAKGVLHASQIAAGEDNNLSLRVYATHGSIRWAQEQPEQLIVATAGQPRQVWQRGADYLDPHARALARVPAGHPEGYLEAFANLYGEAFHAISAEVDGQRPPAGLDFPTVEDGIAGLRFVDAALRSARTRGAWVSVARES